MGQRRLVKKNRESESVHAWNRDARSPWVRVVIVNYNAGALLQASVDALAAQSLTDFEAVVVDNASTNPPVSMLCLPDGRFRVIHAGGNVGFAAGCNIGARDAETPWLAMLNPDAMPRPDWLHELRAATERHRGITMFGSTQLDAADPAIIDGFGDMVSALGTAWRSGGGEPASTLPGGDCEVFSPCGAAALYATASFAEAGGYDERFFCYLEDVDLGFRLRLRGDRCIQVRRAEVLHVGSAIAGRMSDFGVFHSYRNRVWMFAKNLPAPLLAPILPLQIAAILAAFTRRTVRPHLRAASRGLVAGLKGLPAAIRARRDVQPQRRATSIQVAMMLDWHLMRRHVKLSQLVPKLE
ncbi:MAG: glycosyltransferase family 2 protein [Vicinamibacterales bacterium]